MSGELISDPRYWCRRLREAKELHHAVFLCPTDRWQRIERKHREILARHVKPNDGILDAGCGWGRLLGMLPETWHGEYLGVDISEDFLSMARNIHPSKVPGRLVGESYKSRIFTQKDLRNLTEFVDTYPYIPRYDLAVLISVRPMMRRHLGNDEWAKAEAGVRSMASRLLYLEYDENDEGSLE